MGICADLILIFNGKPLDRVSHEKNSPPDCFFSLPDLVKLKVFRHLRMTRMDFAPPPHSLLKKVDENFSVFREV